MLKITLVKSLIGRKKGRIVTAHAPRLRRVGKTVEHKGTPQIKGMISRTSCLLKARET